MVCTASLFFKLKLNRTKRFLFIMFIVETMETFCIAVQVSEMKYPRKKLYKKRQRQKKPESAALLIF